jgi:hypothetical protein
MEEIVGKEATDGQISRNKYDLLNLLERAKEIKPSSDL